MADEGGESGRGRSRIRFSGRKGWRTRMTTLILNSLLNDRRARAVVRTVVALLGRLPGSSRLIADADRTGTGPMTERTLGGVATRVLFDNDRVRVWEMRLAPGERSDLHEHRLDYIIVQISGDRVGADLEPDSNDVLGMAGKHMETAVRPGLAVYVPRGGIETAANVGEQEYHEVLIELKD